MLCLITFLLALFFKLNGTEGGSLFSPIALSRAKLACCDDDYASSCLPLKLNSSALGDEELEVTPLNLTLKYEGMAGNSSNSYHYGNNDIDAVLTYHSELDDLFGHVSLSDGKSYVIEYCGNGVHALKELDVASLGESEAVDIIEENSTDSRDMPLELRTSDTTTVVTYTVKVYYTKEFADVTSDIPGFVDQVIQETNQGYINSKVPLRIKLHCIEQANIKELPRSGDMLRAFGDMKGNTKALRGSADAATLLIKSFDACGIGWFNTIGYGNTVTVSKKDCALGYYSFGHELGHNIGLQHNWQTSRNRAYSDGHGHLINQGSASTGYRTILAYGAPNHYTRVNYYSNPKVKYATTGTPTGVIGLSNNARILTVNRFALAAIGDESESCASTVTTTPASSTLSTLSVPSCAVENIINFKYARLKASLSQDRCRKRCYTSNNCVGWIYEYSTCYIYRGEEEHREGAWYGPDLNKKQCSFKRNICELPNTYVRVRTFTEKKAETVADCEQACRVNRKCSHWTWYRKVCTLKKSQFFYGGKDVTSGPRFC